MRWIPVSYTHLQVADAYTGDGAGTDGTDQIAGHEGHRLTGIHIIEHHHQHRAGQSAAGIDKVICL